MSITDQDLQDIENRRFRWRVGKSWSAWFPYISWTIAEGVLKIALPDETELMFRNERGRGNIINSYRNVPCKMDAWEEVEFGDNSHIGLDQLRERD
jgi:hypothetical protein